MCKWKKRREGGEGGTGCWLHVRVIAGRKEGEQGHEEDDTPKRRCGRLETTLEDYNADRPVEAEVGAETMPDLNDGGTERDDFATQRCAVFAFFALLACSCLSQLAVLHPRA